MNQISSDEETMATVFMPCAIASLICTILSSYIVDKIKHFHVILALFSLASSIAIGTLYFAVEYYQVLIAYVIMSVTCNVFVAILMVAMFRVFNADASWIISICCTLSFLMSTVTPQIIQFSSIARDGDNDYQYAMYIFSVIGLLTTILLLFIPSPKRSKLVQDVEKMKNDFAQNEDNDLEVDTYLDSQMLSPTISRYLSTAPKIQSQMSQAVINELRAVQNQCDIRSEKEQYIVDNLFFDYEDAIKPYQVSVDDDEDEHLMHLKDKVRGFWFDCEKKTIEMQSVIQQRNVTYSFALIAIVTELCKCSNRYVYLAFITTFVRNVHDLSTADGLNLITMYFIGVFIGQFITTFLLKIFKPQNICLVFSILMLFGAICFVLTIYIEQYVLITLYVVSVLNGFGSSPLYSATLAALCNIQPLTGILSSMYNLADVFAGFTVSIAGLLITQIGIEIGLNYVHLTISLFMCLLFVINKVKYDKFMSQ